MEPKSDSVIITIADSNKGPRPSPTPTDIIDHTSIKEAAHDHQSDHHHHDHQSDDHHHDVGPTSAAAPAPKKKRSGGAMHILQLAVFMLRRRHRSDRKSKPTSFEGQAQAVTSTKGTWKRLVGSIRPLHLQTTSNSTPPSSVHTPAPSERYEDVLPPPMSPARTDDLSSEDGMTSRYASAVNLQELDRTDEDNDNASIVNANIDAKAEEFIAQFYQQMRLQRLDRLDSVHLSCNDTIRRSTS
ncbi:unnamed protein product [Prunus armeniaca]|uniref:Uncharacterized protein n=1 Tax=Prunus armeniaca TaxID=36596 RepID=A0A6J5VVK6_PRUAR|nr:hypothetical protein GBA52_027900 [Prunus armeniaca]CAB4291912.1 unnamed protein product [Prunus armeniaca]